MRVANWLIALLGVAALLALAGASTVLAAGDLPFFLAMAFLPFLAVCPDDKGKEGEEEEDDERSRTIVAMPAWMAEEIQKEREKLSQDSTRTLAFDPSEAIKAAGQAAAGRMSGRNGAAEASAAGEESGTSRTLMFDPKAAAAVRQEATEPESDMETNQTAAYSPDEVKRLRESLRNTREEDEGNARTVAYMPAVTAQKEPEAPKEEGDAFAATVAYMPAVTATENGTLAYGPGEKEKLLQSLGRKPAEPQALDEGSATTQAYSKEQAKAVKDAYALLEGSRKGQGTDKAAPPAAAGAGPASTTEAAASATTSPGGFSSVPSAAADKSAAPPPSRPSPRVSPLPEDGQKSGMSTGALIALLIVLLALAGGAMAVILHLVGIVDLPLPLPQLDLFSK